jgi:hypothetical protein
MDVDWNAELLNQLEDHWQGQLRPRLDGLTDDEYFWQPVPDCWTISRRGESLAPISFGAGEFTMDYGQPPHDPEPRDHNRLATRTHHRGVRIDERVPLRRSTREHLDILLRRHRPRGAAAAR